MMLYVTESLPFLQAPVPVIENQAAGYKLAHHWSDILKLLSSIFSYFIFAKICRLCRFMWNYITI